MDYSKAFQSMQNDPDFKKLAYTDQVAARQQLFAAAQTDDPQFKTLNDADQRSIYAQTVFSPPALQDPVMQQQFSDFMSKVDAGDPKALVLHDGMYFNMKAANSGSLIGRLVGTAGNIGMGLGEAVQGISAPNPVNTPDEHNIWQYLNVRDALGNNPNKSLQGATNVTNFGLQLADWVPIGNIATSLAKGAIGAGAALGVKGAQALSVAAEGADSLADIVRAAPKFQELAATATNFGQRALFNTILPHAIAGAATMGAVGLPYMKMMADINQTPEADPYSSAGAFAANMGLGMAMDVGVGFLTRDILPAAWNMVKGLFTKLSGTGTNLANPEELQNAIQDFSTGQDVGAPLQAQFNEFQQARNQHGIEVNRIGNLHPQDLTDEDRLILGAHVGSQDITIDPQDDGSYNIFHLAPTSTIADLKTAHAPSLPDAYDTVAETLKSHAELQQSVPLETQAHVPWIFNWEEAGNGPSRAVDGILPHAGTEGKIALQDRPYIGANELDHLNGPGAKDAAGNVAAIPIRMEMSSDGIDRLNNGQQAFSYNDILKPMQPDPVNANAAMLSRNVLDMPTDAWNQGGNALAIRARMNGYDTIRLTNPDNTTAGLVPLSPNSLKMLVDNVDHITGKPVDLAATVPSSVTRDAMTASVSYKIARELPFTGLSDNPKLLTQFAAQKFGKSLDPADVKLFIQSAMGRNDVPIHIRQAAFADTIDQNNPLKFSYDKKSGIDAFVPNGLSNPASTLRFTNQLVDELGALRRQGVLAEPGLGPSKLQGVLRNVDENHPFFKIMQSSDNNQQIAGESWMRNILQSEFQANLVRTEPGKYVTQIGQNSYSGSLSDIYQSVWPGLVPPSAIRESAAEMGMSIKQSGGDILASDAQGNVAKYSSYADLAEKSGINTNLLPSKYRPTFIELTPDNTVRINAEQGTISMGKKDALLFLNSFRGGDDIKSIELIQKPGGMASLITTPDVIQFKDSATNSKLNFATMEEARDFAKNQYATWAGQEMIAGTKGLSLDYSKGKFEIRNGDGNVYRFDTMKEAQNYMANFPTKNIDATEMVPGATEILGQMPKDLVAQWKSFNTKLQPMPRDWLTPEIDAQRSLSQMPNGLQTIANLTGTFKTALGKLVRDGKINEEGNRIVNENLAANSAFNAARYNFRKIISGLFSGKMEGTGENRQWVPDTNGKLMSNERAQVVYQHMTPQSAEEYAKTSKDMPLLPGEQYVINQARAIMGERTSTGSTGAFARFGIPYDQFTYNYLPKLHDAAMRNANIMAGLRDGSIPAEFFDSLEANGYDKEFTGPMRNSFEFSRKTDLQDAMLDRNAISCMLRYGDMGLRKLYTDIPNQRYAAWYNAANFPAGSEAAQLLHQWHEVITGHQPDDMITRGIANIGIGIQGAYGNALAKIVESPLGKLPVFRNLDPAALRDPAFALQGAKLFDKFMALQNITYLAAKPMTALRFAMQTYNMFAPAFGFSHTFEAVRWMNAADENLLKSVAQRLTANDVLTASHIRFDITDQGGLLNKIGEHGMAWIKNGDDLIRVLGYKAGYSRFLDSCSKLGKGTFGTDIAGAKQAFINDSMMAMFQKNNPAAIEDIWKAVSDPANLPNLTRGDPAALTAGSPSLNNAADRFASEAVQLTLHNYAQWNRPMLFNNGAIGRLLGQFGSYAACYRNLISQAAMNMDKSQFAGFIATFMAGNLAIMGAMKAAQIKSNFVPFIPGIMGIGPSAQSLGDMLQAVKEGSSNRNLGQFLQQNLPVNWKANRTPQGFLTGTHSFQFNYPQLLPGSMQYHYVSNAIKYAQAGGINGWYRAMLSLSAAAVDSDALSLRPGDLTLPLGPLSVKVPGGNPSAGVQNAVQMAQQIRAPQTLPNLNYPSGQ